MGYSSRTYNFNTGDILLEASLEGEFDAIYNILNGSTSTDISINGDLTVKGGDITLSDAATAIAIKDNTTSALSINEGSNEYVAIDTTDGVEKVNVLNNEILKSDAQLLAAAITEIFGNTTTTYVWNIDSASSESQTDIIGSKALTVVAGELEAANDVLGVSKFCKWSDGDTYLQSTDAVFNVANTANTDDFLVGGWVYIPDVTPAAGVSCLFSNIGAANNGWYIYQDTSGVLVGAFDLVTDREISTTLHVAGWYHIIYAREVGGLIKLYVNGQLVGSVADTTIGATQSKFQFGGYNGATCLPEDDTRYDEVIFRKGELPTNLDDCVRELYARSAKKFAVKDANDLVLIPQNVSSGVYTPILTNTTNVAASTAYALPWTRIGNVVTCFFQAAIDPTATTTTVLTFTLPLACVSTPTGGGTGQGYTYVQPGEILMASATTATYNFIATNVANERHSGTFTYLLN